MQKSCDRRASTRRKKEFHSEHLETNLRLFQIPFYINQSPPASLAKIDLAPGTPSDVGAVVCAQVDRHSAWLELTARLMIQLPG